jgi:hypothetical protein
MILGFLIEFIVVLVFGVIYFMTETIITRKKLKRNQLLWDEYSKNMTFDEKLDCFNDWLSANRAKHGDKFYYIPKM